MMSLWPRRSQERHVTCCLTTVLIFSILVILQPVNANIFGVLVARLSYDVVSIKERPTSLNGLQVFMAGDDLPVGAIAKTAGIPKDGLSGFLYDMGYGCEAGFDANTTLPTPELFGLPRVALIRRGGVTEVTACTFRTKMLVAMNDGAVAAIVYNNPGQGSIEGAAAGTDEAETPIEIPGMMVSYDSGFTLRGYLLNSNNATSPSYNTRVRISMSTDRRMPVIWEFVLIVVVVLLGVSFTISVILHCRLYALRQRYRAEAMARGGDLLPNGTIHMRKTIEKAALDEFPVRIYGQSTPSAPSGSAAVSGTLQASTSMQLPTLNHVQQLPELEQDDSKTTREADGHICERDGYSGGHSPQVARTNSVSGRSMRSVTALAAAETLDSAAYPFIPANEIINDTCAICLDEFSEGEEIRTLPCHHEFHCECIDPWLTCKSSTCPLCKYECIAPTLDNASEDTSYTRRRSTIVLNDRLIGFIMGPEWAASRTRHDHNEISRADRIGNFIGRMRGRIRGRPLRPDHAATLAQPSSTFSPTTVRVDENGDVPLQLITAQGVEPITSSSQSHNISTRLHESSMAANIPPLHEVQLPSSSNQNAEQSQGPQHA